MKIKEKIMSSPIMISMVFGHISIVIIILSLLFPNLPSISVFLVNTFFAFFVGIFLLKKPFINCSKKKKDFYELTVMITILISFLIINNSLFNYDEASPIYMFLSLYLFSLSFFLLISNSVFFIYKINDFLINPLCNIYKEKKEFDNQKTQENKDLK